MLVSGSDQNYATQHVLSDSEDNFLRGAAVLVFVPQSPARGSQIICSNTYCDSLAHSVRYQLWLATVIRLLSDSGSLQTALLTCRHSQKL